MVNVKKLRGKMVEMGFNIESLSNAVGIKKSTLYRRLSDEGKPFTIKEADMLAKELNLTPDEVMSIFFNRYVA